MLGLASNAEMVRNIAVVGHLHHGKTSLVDMLVYETHKIDVDTDRPVSALDPDIQAKPVDVENVRSTPRSYATQTLTDCLKSAKFH